MNFGNKKKNKNHVWTIVVNWKYDNTYKSPDHLGEYTPCYEEQWEKRKKSVHVTEKVSSFQKNYEKRGENDAIETASVLKNLIDKC